MHFTHSFLVCCVKNKTKINYKLCIENGLLGFLTILTHTRTMFPLWMSSQSISNPLFINVSSPLWISTLPWWRGLYFQLLGSPRIKNASHERQINNDRNTASHSLWLLLWFFWHLLWNYFETVTSFFHMHM